MYNKKRVIYKVISKAKLVLKRKGYISMIKNLSTQKSFDRSGNEFCNIEIKSHLRKRPKYKKKLF